MSSRAPFICNLTRTCTVCCFAITSHACLRSARAPHPKLLEPARDGHPCIMSAQFFESPRSCAQPPRLRPLPDQ
eukprot:1217793-Pleurochrysis_carterae.AAC.1